MAAEKELTKRQQQAIDSKNRLIKAAETEFNENGYQRTSIQQICRAAGLSVGVFYYYFSSKKDALIAVQSQKQQELLNVISTESVSKNHVDALVEIFSFIARQQSSGPFELVCNSFAPTASPFLKKDERLKNLVLDIVKSGQEAGELTSRYDAETITQDLLRLVRGFVFMWCEEEGSFDLIPSLQAFLYRVLRAYQQES